MYLYDRAKRAVVKTISNSHALSSAEETSTSTRPTCIVGNDSGSKVAWGTKEGLVKLFTFQTDVSTTLTVDSKSVLYSC